VQSGRSLLVVVVVVDAASSVVVASLYHNIYLLCALCCCGCCCVWLRSLANFSSFPSLANHKKENDGYPTANSFFGGKNCGKLREAMF